MSLKYDSKSCLGQQKLKKIGVIKLSKYKYLEKQKFFNCGTGLASIFYLM